MINAILSNQYYLLILLMIITAFPVGFFAGYFGIGGGLISVPVLFFIFETADVDKSYLMHLSVGTAFSITIFTAFVSVMTHRKHKAVDTNILKTYGLFVIFGVLLGTYMAALLNTKSLVLFFAVVVYFFGGYLLLVKQELKKIKKFKFLPRATFGFISGFISAPMGITGAMMNVPILRYFGYPISRAIGSSAAIGFVIASIGSIGFLTSGFLLNANLPLSLGFVNIPAFLIFIPITSFMARVGANMVHTTDKNKTQRMFGVFLYVIGTLFLIRFLDL